MSKVALAMIVKETESEGMLLRCLETVAPFVDGVFLTINGPSEKWSTKGKQLKRVIDAYGLTHKYAPINFSWTKWEADFAKARNFNWGQVPKMFDYILWLDADDILRGADKLHQIADEGIQKNFDSIFFNYLYSVEIEGDKIKNVLIEHLRERLIRNNDAFKWVAPIHETLIPQREVRMTDSGLCDVVHLSSDERKDSAIHRNIEILERQVEEQKGNKDPRTLYYLGKAYFDLRTPEMWDRAMKLIKDYLFGSETNLPSGWAEERAQAYEYLAEIYRERHQFNNAIKCILNALQEDPKFPNFYIDMSLIYMYMQDWVKAKHWAELGQKVPYPKTTLVTNPKDMQVRTMEVLLNCALNTNDVDLAQKLAVKIVEYFPDSKDVVNRARALTELKDNNTVAHKIVDVANFLNNTGQQEKLKTLINAIPKQIEQEPVMLGLIRDFTPVRQWEKSEIAILCGRGFEKWSPKSLEKGIGGSEEAVIYLSKELSNLGWQVTVYGDPQEDEGIYNGVRYLPYFKFNPKDHFNIFVGWRSVQVFDEEWVANKSYLWLHDIQNPAEYSQKRLNRITKVFPLSRWHRDNIPNVPEDKIMITSNGINLADFEMLDKENIKRDPHRVIWTSSYDRGLEHLLKMWPDVLAKVPDAQLHICYGWNLFESFYRNNPERIAWKTRVDELMKQQGITHHGRISQLQVLIETYKAGVWAYPTHFGEINCISAMKAQAGGAIPVVCDYAALKETVQHGVKINVDEKDIYDPDIKREFKNQLVKVLCLGRAQDDIREPMMKWAREKFGWANIAKQWDEEFRRDELKEASEVLLKEHPEMQKYLPVQLQERLNYEQTY